MHTLAKLPKAAPAIPDNNMRTRGVNAPVLKSTNALLADAADEGPF
jgi:hypothetical protein